MELSPQAVATATFNTVRKGFDPEDVRGYLTRVAAQLEATQQQAAAMEARARAAIAKLQEMSQASAAAAPAGDPTPAGTATAGATDSEAATISRTLLLAQRTADTTVAEATAEAEAIVAGARADAAMTLDQARSSAASIVEEARSEARRSKDEELAAAEGAVQALLARRDFLLGDVEILEEHVGAQRERLRDAAVALQELVERVPAGLGEVRRPLLSASADDTAESIEADATAEEQMQEQMQDPTLPLEVGGDRR